MNEYSVKIQTMLSSGLLLLLFVFTAVIPLVAAEAESAGNGADKEAQARRWLRERPPLFIANRGQIVDSDGALRDDIHYSLARNGVQLYFRKEGISYVFTRPADAGQIDEAGGGAVTAERRFEAGRESDRRMDVYRMDMRLQDANPDVEILGEEEADAYFNYYYAHCPEGVTNVPAFSRLVYREVYSDIDLVFYTTATGIKYDFVVRPGGDPSLIRLEYQAADAIVPGDDGGLHICTPFGYLEEARPLVYQRLGADAVSAGRRQTVPSSFQQDKGAISFELGAYDPSRELIIDPELHWATYYGSYSGEMAYDLAIVGYQLSGLPKKSGGGTVQFENLPPYDAERDVVVTGWTRSGAFPVMVGDFVNYPASYAGGSDAFLLKFSREGQLRWATFYGGQGDDTGEALMSTSDGDVIVAGWTTGEEFPISASAMQTVYGGGAHDAFVASFNWNGLQNWSSYYGGSGDDKAFGIDVDLEAEILFVTGSTNSSDLAASAGGAQSANGGGASDAFLCRLDGQDGALQWTTYYGGSGEDVGYAVAVTANGNAVITGWSDSDDATLPYIGSGMDVFHDYPLDKNGFNAIIAKFSADGTSIPWAFTYGGRGEDRGRGIDVQEDIIAVAGWTTSDNLAIYDVWQSPQEPWWQDGYPHDYNFNKGPDAFVLRIIDNLEPNHLTLPMYIHWSTYFGGKGVDRAEDAVFDAAGNIWITGHTQSNDIHQNYSLQQEYNGGFYEQRDPQAVDDALLACFRADGALRWFNYYGGRQHDVGRAIEADDLGAVVIAGWTNSGKLNTWRLPGTDYGHEKLYQGCEDVFVAHFHHFLPMHFGGSDYYGTSGLTPTTSIASDADQNILIAGATAKSAFPVQQGLSSGAYQQGWHQGQDEDAVLAKFTSGGRLLWSTYYGGDLDDAANDIAADNLQSILVAGSTSSANFPLHGGGQATANDRDPFLLKFDQDGVLQWANVPSVAGAAEARALAIDGSDNICLAGYNDDVNASLFAIKYNGAGSTLWTYNEGSQFLRLYAYDVAVDANDDFVIVGRARVEGSAAAHTIAGMNGTLKASLSEADDDDLLVLHLQSAAANVNWYSFVGGSAREQGYGIAIDGNDDIILAAFTDSDDLNSMSGMAGNATFSAVNRGEHDALLLKFSSLGSLQWWTYFGAADGDGFTSLSIESGSNDILVGGFTYSTDIQSQPGAGNFAIQENLVNDSRYATGLLCRFSAAGSLSWWSYYGGAKSGVVGAVAHDGGNNLLIYGFAGEASLPQAHRFYSPYSSHYISKLDPGGSLWSTFFE